MTYTPQVWVDETTPGSGTVITAARMNNIETGLDAVDAAVELLNTRGTYVSKLQASVGHGMGTMKCSGVNGGIGWSSAYCWILAYAGRGAPYGTQDYYTIAMPANGTVIDVIGAADVAVADGYIPVSGALYVVAPIAGDATDIPASSLRMVVGGIDYAVPYNWIYLGSRSLLGGWRTTAGFYVPLGVGNVDVVAGFVQPTIVDAKGDLIAATGIDAVARLPVGSNGQVLTADSAETTGMKWAASSGGGGSQIAFSAYKSANSAVAVGYQKVVCDTESVDTNNFYDPILGRFSPPEGHYRLSASLYQYPPPTGYNGLAIYKNGVLHKLMEGRGSGAGSDFHILVGTCLVYSDGDDYFELWYAAGAATSLPNGIYGGAAYTRFEGERLGGSSLGSGGITPVLLDDAFTTDALSAYVADQGTSKTGLLVTGGMLTVADSTDHSFHHATLQVTDATHILKVTPGASANHSVYLSPKFVNDNNFLMMQKSFGGTDVQVYQRLAGTYTSIGTLANGVLGSGGLPVWFVARMSGNVLRVEVWTTNPLLGGDPTSSLNVTLAAGAARTALGAGVPGYPGMRLSGFNGTAFSTTDWKADDWIVHTEDRGRIGPAGPTGDMDTKSSWVDDMTRPKYIKGAILDPSTAVASRRTYSSSGLTLSSESGTQDFTYTANDIELVDQKVITKFQFGFTTGMTVGNLLKVRSSTLGILCYCDPASLYIYLGTSGSGGALAGPGLMTNPSGNLAANTDYWLESSIIGNVITSNLYTSDPTVGTPTAKATLSYTLLSTNATNLGTGRHGSPGVRAVPNVTSSAFVLIRQTKIFAL